MLERLRNAFGALFGREAEPLSMRRWEAAKTDRLNESQVREAANQGSVNSDLVLDRENLVKRSTHEAENNPFVEGVINTHVFSVVGSDGPSLQVHSSDQDYNDTLEQIFWNVWQLPDIAGRMSGAEILKMCVRQPWTQGEYVMQEVEDTAGPLRRISARLNMIHPRRVRNPITLLNQRTIMGVERDRNGKILNYYVTDYDAEDYSLFVPSNFDSQAIPAKNIIHDFEVLEPGQVRGVPYLAPCLPVISDLRSLDTGVMDALRQATDFAAMLVTKHADAKYVAVNEQISIPRRTLSTAPPGWELQQIDPKHPTTNYIEYRRERLRELGRPVNMPLMMVLLDSGEHNYSSARFDGQLYNRGVTCKQKRLENMVCNRFLFRVERQAQLAGLLNERPDDAEFCWTWPVAPHVDPQKEALAWKELIQIGGASEFDVAASMGRDFESIVKARARAAKLLKEAGLPATGTTPMSDAEQAQDENAKATVKQKSKQKASAA